jgi:hypothetical protein
MLIPEFDQLQDMRMVQARNCTRLSCKTTTHLAIIGKIAQDDFNRDTPVESCTLPTFIDGTHPANTNAANDIVIA